MVGTGRPGSGEGAGTRRPGSGSRSGARAALPPFETLVTAHGAIVLRVCRGLVGEVDADDVWQETFLAALRVYPDSGGVRNWEAWLVSIARNKAVDHHRKALRLPTPVDSGGPAGTDRRGGTTGLGRRGGVTADGDHGSGDSSAGGGDVVVREVEAGEAAAEVWAALAKLPPTQREAVVYHHLAGLRHALVAELLGNSEAAARRATADGMKKLRNLLAPSQPAPNEGTADDV